MNIQNDEFELHTFDGWIILLVFFFLSTLSLFLGNLFIFGICIISLVFLSLGFFIIHPNEAIVVSFVGKYNGTKQLPGFYWINPLMKKHKISTKHNIFLANKIQSNDNNGNKFELSGNFTWNIIDSSKVIFLLDDYKVFLEEHCNTELRNIFYNMNYNCFDTLIFDIETINKKLKDNLCKITHPYGIDIISAKFNYISYPLDVSSILLKNQQLNLIVNSRTKIIEVASKIAQETYLEIEDITLTELSNDEKIRIFSNLILILVSNNETMLKSSTNFNNL